MGTVDTLTVISQDIYATKEQFDSVLSDRSLNFEREAGFAIQAISAGDYIQKVAMNNRQSVVNAVTNIAAIGISLNPAKKQAYLVPRDNKICLDISYMGLMDLAMATGSVRWAQAALVYAGDTFSLMGYDKPPDHKFNPFSKERGEIVGVYCVVKTSEGEYLTHTMPIDDVYAIRDRSQSWKAFMDKKTKSPGPWGTDEGEMIKKTCVKQAYKYWPKTDRLENAIHHLNNENGEGIIEVIEQTKTGGIQIGAAQGIGDDLSIERKQIIDACASQIADLFEANDVIGAYEVYTQIIDSDEKTLLWRKLPSNIKTAIKKHGELLKEESTTPT